MITRPIAAFLFILLVIGGCTAYYETHIYSPGHLQKVSGPLPDDPGYTVYITDKQHTYKLSDPKINGDTITGTASVISHTQQKNLNNLAASKDLKIYRINTDTLVSFDGNGHVSLARNDVTYLQVNEPPVARQPAGNGQIHERQLSSYSRNIIYLFIFLLAVIFYFVMLPLVFGVNSWGCYIATMVYGSYDADEVLVLRKYRDNILAKNIPGRIFIRVYYTLSPLFVRVFRNNITVNNFCRSILDRVVAHLRAKELLKQS